MSGFTLEEQRELLDGLKLVEGYGAFAGMFKHLPCSRCGAPADGLFGLDHVPGCDPCFPQPGDEEDVVTQAEDEAEGPTG